MIGDCGPEVAANKYKLSDINPPTVVVMSNSAKDTMEGVMGAMGNVAKGAEEIAKEVVTEVRLSRHPHTFLTGSDFSSPRKSCSRHLSLASLPLLGAKEKGQKTKASTT